MGCFYGVSMRSLTEAEARVIRSLLANPSGPERQRIRDAEVPRTTYQTVRRRALIHGWLSERYVPDPLLFGSDRVRLILAQPYAERWNDSIRLFRSFDGLAVLWASAETLLGVLFESEASQLGSGSLTDSTFRRSWTLNPSVREGQVVSYFDFEGAWSRWTLGKDPLAYPRGLPAGSSDSIARARADRTSVWELVSYSMGSMTPLSTSSAFRSPGLSRGARRLLAARWFAHRIFPNLADIPPIRGYRPQHVVFVTAKPLPDKAPRDLFAELTQLGRSAPFLFVYEWDRVLFATLAPAPGEAIKGRPSMVELLQRFVSKVEVVREPLDSLIPLLNHRYDRLALPRIRGGARPE